MNWNRLVLAGMAALAVIMGWQLYQKRNADNGQLSINMSGDTLVLSWRGQIEIPMSSSMRRAFQQHKDQTTKVVLILNSQGGALREGSEVIDLLEQAKRTSQLTTIVPPQGICMSMCVPIFLHGQSRIAAADSRFMFHEPKRFYDDGTEARGFSFEREALSRRFFEKYFVNSPIDPAWLKALEQQWVGKDVFKTGRELVDERTNVVTGLVR